MIDPARADAAARAPAARALRRRARARPARPQGGRPARQGRTARATTSSRSSRGFRQVVERAAARARIGSRDLAVDGNDLIALGYPPGPAIGHALRSCSTRSCDDPTLNTTEQLLAAGEGAPAVIRWDQPGLRRRVHDARRRRERRAVYESLNLTAGTGDDPERVEENRRRACAELGARRRRGSSFNRQVHSPTVHRAGAGSARRAGRRALDATSRAADARDVGRLPADRDRAHRRRPPALALVHAGWRGLREGIVAAGVAALGGGETAAVVGPAIGPCCYEVGEEVVGALRRRPDARRQARPLDGGRARAARAPASTRVERVDLCTRCNPELFFSHRRSGRARGVQGVIGAVA